MKSFMAFLAKVQKAIDLGLEVKFKEDIPSIRQPSRKDEKIGIWCMEYGVYSDNGHGQSYRLMTCYTRLGARALMDLAAKVGNDTNPKQRYRAEATGTVYEEDDLDNFIRLREEEEENGK